MLYGNTKFLERSNPNSLLKGDIFRKGSSDEIYYYTQGTTI